MYGGTNSIAFQASPNSRNLNHYHLDNEALWGLSYAIAYLTDSQNGNVPYPLSLSKISDIMLLSCSYKQKKDGVGWKHLIIKNEKWTQNAREIGDFDTFSASFGGKNE